MWAAWVHGAPSPRQELVYNVESIGIQETWAEMNFYNMSRQRFWRTAVKPDTSYMTPLPGETLDEFKAKWNPGAAIPGGGTGRYGPLHDRSVAHPFLLAAFHSKFIGEQ